MLLDLAIKYACAHKARCTGSVALFVNWMSHIRLVIDKNVAPEQRFAFSEAVVTVGSELAGLQTPALKVLLDSTKGR